MHQVPLAHRNIEAREVRSFKRLIHSSRVVVVKMESKKPAGCLCHLQYNIPRIHVVFTFLIPLLMGLLQVNYQTKKVSPMDTHPINIWIFIAATWLYARDCLSRRNYIFINGSTLKS
ncbi:hypothetical protein Ddye_018107 [Dipteronia dyeriana]|uniref:Uncharacterized protein n=1 Tax=Dipteronia dyeriana TaxID=168575 RepID=A0AAD9UAK2_9ROSI|nr:hypothetical protein Ddye_018107 [Dipteronia dyeriana]